MLTSLTVAISVFISALDCTMVPGSGAQRLDLKPTGSVSAAQGTVELKEAVARGAFDAGITVQNLPAASTLGPYAVWVVWAASRSLDRVVKLGTVSNTDTLRIQVDNGTPMFLVSAEPDTAVTMFHALVLVGRCMRPVPNR